MPWRTESIMEKKVSCMKEYLAGEYSVSEIARRYRVSRKTIYKYIKRYAENGERGLEELSRAPRHSPNQTDPEILDAVINCKLQHQYWGPKKVIARLTKDNPGVLYPSPSTAQLWLKRYGLVKSRKVRHRVPPYTQPFLDCNKSNDTWSIDYKGQFKLSSGRYCYPLTLEDNFSRYLLLCIGLTGTEYEDTYKWLKWAFQKYGLPRAIRSDNGTPFAAPGLTGLSRLSIWFIQLGITLERIDKGCPSQNGRLERFHRTLKEQACESMRFEMVKQQELFAQFKEEYNTIRPHESLFYQTPSELYIPSEKRYPEKISNPEYNSDMLVRKVTPSGEISLAWSSHYICKLLAGEYIGLITREERLLDVYYYDQIITTIDASVNKVYGNHRRLHREECLSQQRKYQPWKEANLAKEHGSTRYASQSHAPSLIVESACQNH